MGALARLLLHSTRPSHPLCRDPIETEGEAGPSAAGASFPTTVYEQATWIDGVHVDKINNTSQWL